MMPTILLGTANIPNNGGELRLTQRGDDFVIGLKGELGELMTSRMYSSEQALAELGCAHIHGLEQVRVLVGGMGMGFTLAAALKATTLSSEVHVAELVPEIIEWNKGALGACAGRPLDDERVRVHVGDVAALFETKRNYDAILLDVDNGPEAFTHVDNNSLYSVERLQAIHQTLRPKGMLAVWSAWHEPSFTKKLQKANFKNISVQTVRAHQGKGSKHMIYLAQK